MKTIGVTGGIGSGKSVVCKVLEANGFPVFYSDDEAKKIIQSNDFVISELVHLLGPETYVKGVYNRAFVSQQLFSNPSLREMVNQIVHPAVRSEFQHWKAKQKAKLVFNEAAILFETGMYKQYDATILITAPIEVRIERIKSRDHLTKEEIEARINSQLGDAEKIKLATYTVNNDGKSLITIQIEKILADLLT